MGVLFLLNCSEARIWSLAKGYYCDYGSSGWRSGDVTFLGEVLLAGVAFVATFLFKSVGTGGGSLYTKVLAGFCERWYGLVSVSSILGTRIANSLLICFYRISTICYDLARAYLPMC